MDAGLWIQGLGGTHTSLMGLEFKAAGLEGPTL